MGLIVNIYTSKANGDSSSGGISSSATMATLVEFDGSPIRGPFEPTPERPAVRIVVRRLRERIVRLHAEPVDQAAYEGYAGPMAGGAFIWASDSGFRGLSPYPVPLHDRWESPESQRMSPEASGE